jgi:hypothetical protein
MNSIENALNQEFANVLGTNHDWMKIIAGTVSRRANKFAQTQNALLEDVITDVSGDILIQAKSGGLAEAIIQAKNNSKDNDELVENLRHVVMKAAFYRASNVMRGEHEKYQKVIRFSQMNNEDADYSQTIQAPTLENDEENQNQYQDYVDLIVDELELMAQAHQRKNKNRLAKRFRLAQEVARNRAKGMNINQLMTIHNVPSKSTMQAILDDIAHALANVAKQSNNNTLLYGVKKHAKVA